MQKILHDGKYLLTASKFYRNFEMRMRNIR